MRVLAIDPGTKRWGVGVGESETGLASPLCTLTGTFERMLADVLRLYESERAEAMLVGRPLHMDDKPHRMTVYADRLIAALSARGITVHPFDERLTTFAAEAHLSSRRQSARSGAIHRTRNRRISSSRNKAQVDAVAAAMMLEEAFRGGVFGTKDLD